MATEKTQKPLLPKRTQTYKSHHFDSECWDDYKPRTGDIVIASSLKAGTSWVQTIVFKLLFPDEKKAPGPMPELSPWVDLRVPERKAKMERIEAQKHRRFLKTHLPLDALPYHKNVKYVYVVRSGLDIFMSLMHHYETGNDLWYRLLNETPGRVGPPLPRFPGDVHQMYANWAKKGWPSLPKTAETQGYPFWSVLHSMKTWWAFKHLPNIYFVHHMTLCRDLAGEIKRLADYLDIKLPDPNAFKALVTACTFKSMSARSSTVAPLHGAVFKDGGKSFVNKGTNGRWKTVLSEDEVDAWKKRVEGELPKDCAEYMETGKVQK